MMKFKNFLVGAAATIIVAALPSSASAATTIDFSGHGTGGDIGSTYAALGVTFSPAQFQQCGGGCPAPTPDDGYFAYNGDQAFTAFFSTPQSRVSFQTVSFSSTLAQVYDASNHLIAEITDNEDYPISEAVNTLSGIGINRIVFSDGGGDYFGPAITNLTFNGTAAVPEPATWAMLIMAFGIVGGTVRRRVTSIAALA